VKIVVTETLRKQWLVARFVRAGNLFDNVMARGKPKTIDTRSLGVALTGGGRPIGRQWPSPGFLIVHLRRLERKYWLPY
jgi:hypothetical protein